MASPDDDHDRTGRDDDSPPAADGDLAGTPFASGRRSGEGRRASLVDRRTYLKYAASAAGAATAVGGAGELAAANHVGELEPPATASDVPDDEPVDRSAMTERRLDVNDGEDLSSYVANSSSGELLVVPEGTYTWSGEVQQSKDDWGIRGEWGGQVTIEVPDGWGIDDGGILLNLYSCDNVLVENLYFDTDVDGGRACPAFRSIVDSTALHHHLVWLCGGTTTSSDGGESRFYVGAENAGGHVMIDGGVCHNRGTISYANNGDRIAWCSRDGKLTVRNCKASGFGDNIIYTRMAGEMVVENCVFANATPSCIRVGGDNETVRNSTFYMDVSGSELYETGGNVNTSFIMADNRQSAANGGYVENCSFVVRDTPNATGAIRMFDNRWLDIQDSQFLLDQSDIPGIGVQNEVDDLWLDATAFATENGSGATAAESISGTYHTTDVCVHDGLDLGAISPDTTACGFDWSQAHEFPQEDDFTIPDEPGSEDPDASGHVEYEGDATAVTAAHYDTSDRAGVEFTVTNTASQDLTITHLAVEPRDAGIDELHDESSDVGRWVSEIHVDADVQTGVCDSSGSATLPNTFDLANDGFDDSADDIAVLSAGSTAAVALGRFEASGTPVDMVGESVDVTADFELADGTTGSSSFTLDVEADGDLTYEGDATAVNASHYDTSDQAGVEFTLANGTGRELTLTHVSVTPHDASIDELHDESNDVGRWVSEVHVDADVQTGVCDVPGSGSLPRTFDLANDGFDDSADQVAVTSAGSTASVALGRFEASGTPVDMVGKPVDVEVDYEFPDGTTGSSSFTLDPA